MIEILQKQRQYFDSFQTFDVNFRIEKLKDLKAKILKKRDDIFNALKKDLNKHEFEVLSCELGLVMNELNYLIKNLKNLAEDKVGSASILNYPAKNFRVYEPYGVTLVVSPWNYPFQLTMIPVIGAIAGGNTVVVKPSRNTPNVTRIIKEILSIFPEEYVYVVTDEEKINQLFDQKFDFIFYTGSVSVGKDLLKRQAEYVTPMILELGGKCPCIVSKSANIKVAAKRIAFGKFLNAGQTCVAPDFLLVDAKIKDKFLEKLIKYVQEFYYKDGVLNDTFVRVINQKALDGILNRINQAKVVFGGNVNGLTLEPTILDNVSFDDEIMQEEIFGPVLPIIVYDDLDEVVRRLRTMPKPLALYYFGKNQKEGAEVLKRCPSGGGCINEVVMHVAEANLPFGGVGESGMGSYHGKNTFYAFVHEKSVLKKSTKFDSGKKYPPYNEAKLKFVKGVFGLTDKIIAKAVEPASVNENVEFATTPEVEEVQLEEQVATPEAQIAEEYVQEVEDQVVDTQDYAQDTEETVYNETIVPDGELELEETGDAQEIEVLDETAEEVADETTEDVVEDVNEEQTEVEEVATEDAEINTVELEVDNDEIADITEQTSTIDREPEDFEEDYVEPQEDGDITDVEDDFSEEEEIIEAIDAEIKELYENEDDDEGDAEQADDLTEDVVSVETAETPIVEESLETQPVDDAEYVEPVGETVSDDTYIDEQEETDTEDEGYVPEFSEVANIALEQLGETSQEDAETTEEEVDTEEDYEQQVQEDEIKEVEEQVEEVETDVTEVEDENVELEAPIEDVEEIVPEEELGEEIESEDETDDDEGAAEQADDLAEEVEPDLEEDEEELEDEEEDVEEDIVDEPEIAEEIDDIEQPEEIEDVEELEAEEEVKPEEEPKETETTNEVFKMLEEIEKEAEESAEEPAEEVVEEAVEETEPETTNEVFKMLEEIEKETEEETKTEEAETEEEVKDEIEPEVEVEETVEEEKEVKKEEKPKKTTTKKATKSTAEKTTTKKSTAKNTKKKADDDKKTAKKTTTKKSSTKKTTTTKKEKTEKVEPKEKKPTKRAVSKKVDARNDAQRAQDEINAMLNNMIPNSVPKKEDELEDSFLDSLNSLVSKNIDSDE